MPTTVNKWLNTLEMWVIEVVVTAVNVWEYVREVWECAMDTKTPAHIEYRRIKISNLTRLLGKTVSWDTHPRFYEDWTISEVVRFNEMLVAPEAVRPLIFALDAEYRGDPFYVPGWEELIAIDGREPKEDGQLDWSKLE